MLVFCIFCGSEKYICQICGIDYCSKDLPATWMEVTSADEEHKRQHVSGMRDNHRIRRQQIFQKKERRIIVFILYYGDNKSEKILMIF